jgi:hypothetical protein
VTYLQKEASADQVLQKKKKKTSRFDWLFIKEAI